VGKLGQTIDDEFVIRKGSKFLFEDRPIAGPCFMSGRELEVADDRAEPLLCLASKRQSKIGEGGSVVPLVGDLTLVDSGHELHSRNGVLVWLAVKFRKFNNLRFQRDIGVG